VSAGVRLASLARQVGGGWGVDVAWFVAMTAGSRPLVAGMGGTGLGNAGGDRSRVASGSVSCLECGCRFAHSARRITRDLVTPSEEERPGRCYADFFCQNRASLGKGY
jgi:hypothetical protein